MAIGQGFVLRDQRLNGWQLFNMNLGFWGIQVCHGLQIADASAIFEALGASASQVPLLWSGHPWWDC
ncbi:hypothetical protein C7271_21265 [filamentous cyanobacterium CCP5]|nr:hypothetical protein C7271_21265 [filamentous cyanobacterium CCP5]